MDMLHRLYVVFDTLCEHHVLFKVETIGARCAAERRCHHHRWRAR
jgi:hypothetical protein